MSKTKLLKRYFLTGRFRIPKFCYKEVVWEVRLPVECLSLAPLLPLPVLLVGTNDGRVLALLIGQNIQRDNPTGKFIQARRKI